MESHPGKVVRELRDLKGWTLRQLASKLKMDYSGLARRERGETDMRASERLAVAKLFGLTLDEFDAKWNVNPSRSGLPGIPVINRAPAGEVIDYNADHYGGEYHEAWQFIDRGMIGEDDAYAVVVVGDSMEPNIRDGDICIFLPLLEHKPQRQPQHGQIVFIRYTDDAPEQGCCLCRWSELDDGQSWLLSKDNRRYSAKVVDPTHVARMGILIEHRKKWA